MCNRLFPKIAALHDQRSASAAGINSTVGESSSGEPKEEKYEPLGINLQEAPKQEFMQHDFHIETGTEATLSLEHQFIDTYSVRSIYQTGKRGSVNLKSFSPLKHESEEIASLQFGEPEPKRQKQSGLSLNNFSC